MPDFKIPNLKSNPPSENLFGDDAKEVAGWLDTGRQDKYTQLRRFYDEVSNYHSEIGDSQEAYSAKIAFFKMIGSKAAYAKGRDLISDACKDWLQNCVKQVDSPITLKHFKFHFEAVLGFVKERNKS
jgi:CRISPR-associated protein Csm2